MLSFEEARARLLADLKNLPSERVSIRDARGRVLAQDIAASGPFPPFDGSAMDGYAVSTADFSGDGPWTLPVIGESRTGSVAPSLTSGSTCRIFTGAMVPAFADAVVMQEVVEREGDMARFRERPRKGAHVRRAGEDLVTGAVALTKGTRLFASQIALAASLDFAELTVSRRPVVTILSTGDELRAPGSPPRPASIAESNGIGLAILAEQAGAIVHLMPIVRDDPDETARAITDALRTTDVLLTVGGVSVGDHDVVRPALERSGVTLDFWRVAIKPGKPIAVGKSEHAIVLGLPGNPVSALVTFLLFGMPLLRALAGDRQPIPGRLRVRAGAAITRQPGRTEFLRATLDTRGETPIARPVDNQASGALVGLSKADGLLIIPAELEHITEGTLLDYMRIEDA